MEESVTDKPNELQFSFLTLRLFARGRVALVMAGAVSLLIIAISYRVIQ
jgi:hypothetical protein